MLNFLRKLRQKNVKGKYVKYALGEIFLVVIGILIALSINGLNQRLKNKNTYERMVTNLVSEFSANLEQIETVKRNQKASLQASNQLIHLMSQPAVYEIDSLTKWIGYLGNLWSYDAQNGVLKNVMSSGDIHLLKSDSLKNLMFGWEGLTNDLKEEQTRLNDDFVRVNTLLEKYIQIGDAIYYYRDRFPKSSFKSDFSGLLRDPTFEDMLFNKGIYLLDQLEELETLRKRNILIVKFLKKEN
ncbi:DUF6090 family protein [Roseivirga misakiensis]|uniref:Uncharacterized protein n=1 Tax=Roseivirga misakiensis TaxID=1563681 RepID=A0A1E5T4G4_9BACT|nr:DUF6090 family protein [Roseivirga misakiensis]OEK06246.1 hypothetical protein BFP71_00800 [Roseivirga misakiensis]